MNDQTPSSDEATLSPTASDFELRPAPATADDEIPIVDDIFEALVLNDAETEDRRGPVKSSELVQ